MSNFDDSYAYKYGYTKSQLENEIRLECLFASRVADRHMDEFATMYVAFTKDTEKVVQLAKALTEKAEETKEVLHDDI